MITKTTGWRWCIVAAIAFCLAVSLSVGGSSPIAHASPGCNGGAGAVCVWGANDHGQLGLGTTWDADVPIQMSGAATNGEVSLAAGGDHSLSLVQDPSSELTRVYAWGDGRNGQLGDGQMHVRFSPQVVPLPSDRQLMPAAIAAGAHHSLALEKDGTLYGWGDNSRGQLGQLSALALSPTIIPAHLPAGVTIADIAAGGNDSYALLSDGTVLAWGDNTYGQLGAGLAASFSSTPVQVMYHGPAGIQPFTHVKSLAVGNGFVVALRQVTYGGAHVGAVYAWGRNDQHQLGDGTNINRSTPVLVRDLTEPTGWLINASLTAKPAVAAGDNHALAVKSDGTVVAWGNNAAGQLGTGNTQNNWMATPVVDREDPARRLTGIAGVVAGSGFSAAVKKGSGVVYAWGDNTRLELGRPGVVGYYLYPRPVVGLKGVHEIAAGDGYVLAGT